MCHYLGGQSLSNHTFIPSDNSTIGYPKGLIPIYPNCNYIVYPLFCLYKGCDNYVITRSYTNNRWNKIRNKGCILDFTHIEIPPRASYTSAISPPSGKLLISNAKSTGAIRSAVPFFALIASAISVNNVVNAFILFGC